MLGVCVHYDVDTNRLPLGLELSIYHDVRCVCTGSTLGEDHELSFKNYRQPICVCVRMCALDFVNEGKGYLSGICRRGLSGYLRASTEPGWVLAS